MTDALLSTLEKRANARGVVLADEEALSRELQIPRTVLVEYLAELEAESAIEILAPLPFLVLKLRKWAGRRSEAARMPAKTAGSEVRPYSFQSSLSRSKRLKESYRQPEGDALLREILETLGETDPATFRGALKSYAPDVIRTALDRVRRMKTIRKNRTAVFRFLLPRIAKETPSIN